MRQLGSFSDPHAPPRDRAWVEVNTSALRRNLDRIADAAGPGIGMVPMVKADGYGLGAERVVRALRSARPVAWGVSTVEEGVHLRRLGVAEPVWICAPVPPQSLGRAVAANLVPSISDLESLAVLRRIAVGRAGPVRFQIEIDTGMGRAGFQLAPRSSAAPGLRDWWRVVVRAANGDLRLHGVFTHLHSADEPDPASAARQVRLFDDFVWAARAAGDLPADAFVHCANSAATLRVKSETANAARPGIFLYGAATWAAGPDSRGASPSGGATSPEPTAASRSLEPTRISRLPDPVGAPRRPEPVASVRARILLVRDVPAGATVGYGAIYRAPGPERWAAAGIGYGDGLPRALGGCGAALVAGRPAPMVGRISMDSTVLRISALSATQVDRPGPGGSLAVAPAAASRAAAAVAPESASPAAPGDVVTFVGRDGDAEVRLETVAAAAATIPYEILTGLSPRLPRVSV